MKTINKPSENMGGLLKIWAVLPSDIRVTKFGASILATENVVEFYCSPETMQFKEESVSENSTSPYQTELTGFIPKDCIDNSNILNHLSGRKWILIFQDQNEQFKVTGTNEIPHRFSIMSDSGKQTSDLNGHSISFHSKQLNRALIISNPFE